MKINIKNERVKRRFFRWLKGADGCCQGTVDCVERSILVYEDFTKQADLVTFKPDTAIEFKKWLLKREYKGKLISITTYHAYLRNLRKFFTWLSWQAGYKSKIRPDIIAYLKISEKEERMATQNIPRNYPPLEYVKKLVNSIDGQTEVDLRDKALISFTLVSGMRDKAIATLPIGCFNEDTLAISQNPRVGVQTKFAKYIPSTLMRFDGEFIEHVKTWIKHLKSKGFGFQDPLFPRSKSEHGEGGISFEKATEVEPVYWKGTGRIREVFKARAAAAGLPYYPPHTFRHLAVDLALKACKTGEHIKAVSQNFGHEHIATTLSSYANYDMRKLPEVLGSLDFSGKTLTKDDQMIEKIKKIVLAS